MEFNELVNKRRTAREFTNKEVSKKQIEEVLHSASLAPSAKNRQPWKFYVLNNEQKNHIMNMLVEWEKSNRNEKTSVKGSAEQIRMANKMIMIYNGVEDKVNKSNLKLNWDRNKINLLFVGRLDRQKGLDLFLDVYNKMELDNVHLYVIGTSVLDNSLPKNTETVTYLGWVDNKDIDAYYQACDAVIMPSRWEGFGLVAIEAMRNSKPVIASNMGALPELIKNNINGYIFDIKNDKVLKEILLNINKNELQVLGKQARLIYLKNFTDLIFIKNIYKLYSF